MQKTAKQNYSVYSGLVTSYDTRPGNKVGLLYNAPVAVHTTRQQLASDLENYIMQRKTI